MTTRESFLAAIAAEPTSRELLGFFADWLTDNNDPAESRVYRLAAALRHNGDVGSLEQVLGLSTGSVHQGLRLLPGGEYGEHRIPTMCISWTVANLPEYARTLLSWATEPVRLKAFVRGAKRARNLEQWLKDAEAGDTQALLAHPESRQAVLDLARGHKGRRKATAYTASRKAIAAAKAKLQGRQKRQADRKAAECIRRGRPGRIALLLLAKRKEQALAVAEEYHRAVKSLYQSKYATILYGRGGQETTDRERYSKTWHNSYGAASCCNAGARLDNEDHPTCVILENYRGTEVARLPMPKE